MSTFYRRTWDDKPQKEEMSTAQKFYDIEEGQRRYQQLIEQNLWLKQQIQKTRLNQSASCCQPHICRGVEPMIDSRGGDMVLWSMMERNRYLESKIDKLRNQYERQTKTIQNIKGSQKWRNRFQCDQGNGSCYEEKYLQLLRVKSPFY